VAGSRRVPDLVPPAGPQILLYLLLWIVLPKERR